MGDTMPYVATINVPGYLPMDEEPPIFVTARDAWEYLADERERDEDGVPFEIELADGEPLSLTPMSRTWAELDERARQAARALTPDALVCEVECVGTVYGPTPGYEGDHDLGLAYSVMPVGDEL